MLSRSSLMVAGIFDTLNGELATHQRTIDRLREGVDAPPRHWVGRS